MEILDALPYARKKRKQETPLKALVFSRPGGLDQIKCVDLDADIPGPNQVRVRMTSVGLNRADLLYPAGRYFFGPEYHPPYGYCRLGFEGAGIVEACGTGSRWQPGDRVGVLPLRFDVSREGLLAQSCVLPDEVLVPTPPSVSDEEAGGIWMAWLTAWGGLSVAGQLQPEQSVVITAASSSVGVAAIQTARALQARPLAVTTSEDKVKPLLDLGAAAVFVMPPHSDEHSGENGERYQHWIRQQTASKGSDLVFDAVAGPGIRELIRGSARRGRVVLQGLLDRRPMDVHAGVMMKRLLTLQGYTVDSITEEPESLAQGLSFIRRGFADGDLRPVTAARFPLTQYREAFAFLESNQHIGKIIVNPHAA